MPRRTTRIFVGSGGIACLSGPDCFGFWARTGLLGGFFLQKGEEEREKK